MKIKNKLIALLTVSLVSCQYSPAYANITDNSTVYLGEQVKELSICKDIAGFAYVSMQAHQNGVSEEDQLTLAPAPSTQAERDIKLILDEITYTAWQLDIVESKYGKAYLSNQFGKQVYLMCVGGDWL